VHTPISIGLARRCGWTLSGTPHSADRVVSIRIGVLDSDGGGWDNGGDN
jgi:hypothetical protein